MRNDLCDFNDAYIVVTGKATATDPDPDDGTISYDRTIALKNSAPFFNCILKKNTQLIEDARDLDIVMPMYNLLYYSKNFRKTTGSIWNYYPGMSSFEYAGNYERTRILYPNSNSYSKSFDYKTKLVGSLFVGEDELENIKIVVSLKNLSNFMFNLDFSMINSEIELILKWTKNYVLTEKAEREEKAATQNPPQDKVPAVNVPSDLKFSITDCKLYVPVVTFKHNTKISFTKN